MNRKIVSLLIVVLVPILFGIFPMGCGNQSVTGPPPVSEGNSIYAIFNPSGKLVIAWQVGPLAYLKPAGPGDPVYSSIIKVDGTDQAHINLPDQSITSSAQMKRMVASLPDGYTLRIFKPGEFDWNAVTAQGDPVLFKVGEVWQNKDVPVSISIKSIQDNQVDATYQFLNVLTIDAFGIPVNELQRSLIGFTLK